MVLKTLAMEQNVRNTHIYIEVMKQHIPQNAYFLRKSRKTDFCPLAALKIGFLRFSQKPSILEHMLLHNAYINVAIAVILS